MEYTDGLRFCEKMLVYAAIGFFILGYQFDIATFTAVSAGLFLGTSFGNYLAWKSYINKISR